MRLRIAAIALVLAGFAVQSVSAQLYPSTPAPSVRSTSPAKLEALARDREVMERFRRGLDAEARADWHGAVEEFTRIIALDPDEPRNSTAQYDVGIAYARLDEYAAAEGAFEEALRRDSGFAAAAANLVEVALLAGDLPRARAAADRFAAVAPASLRARYERGLVALRSGDLVAAKSNFAALAEASPAYAIAHYDLAVTDMRAGEFSAAHEELGRALALSPGYVRARFALAVLLVRENRRDEANAELDRVLRETVDPSLRDLAASLRSQLAVNRRP